MTFKSPSLDNSVNRSSCTPSTKNTSSSRALRLANGSTAIDGSEAVPTSPVALPAPVVINRKVSQRDGEHADNDEVELAASLGGHGPLPIHVLIALDTLWGQFEGPGQDQCHWQTGSEQQKHQLGHPGRQFQNRHDNVSDLEHQPADHGVR